MTPGARWPRWLVLALIGVLAALAVGWGLGGPAGAAGIGMYLGLILVPGLIVLALLAARFRPTIPGPIETVVYANLLGIGLLIAVGWTLARFGAYQFLAAAGLEVLLVLVAVAVARRAAQRVAHRLLQGSLPWDRAELLYLAGTFAIGVCVVLPVLLSQASGFLVADDTATFAAVANHLVSTGSWNSAVQLFPGLPAGPNNVQFDNPGPIVFYAAFAAATGVNAIYLAGPLYLLPAVLSSLAMFLLLRRFCRSSIVCYALPLLWLLGCETGTTLFYNNLTDAVYYGIIPDAVLALVGYLVTVGLLVDLGRERGSGWYEIAVIAAAVLVVAQMDQLTCLMLAVAFVGLGLWVLVRRGWKWSLPRLAVVLAPTLLTIPPYLLPSILSSRSPAVYSGGTLRAQSLIQVQWDQIPTVIGALGLVLVGLAVLGLLAALLRRGALQRKSPALDDVVVLGVFALLALLGFYLTFSAVGTDLLGISSSRFLEYGGLALVPLAAVGIDRAALVARRNRVGRRATGVALLAIVLAVGAASAGTSYAIVGQSTGSASAFTPTIMQAATWLADHAPPNVTIVADGMGGNQALIPISDFVPNPFFDRPQFTLENAITAPPIGTAGNPYAALNAVMQYPTLANAERAWTNFSMEYYVYQVGYSNAQIAAFSHLPYFQLVFSNSQVYIFQFVGGSGPGFIPATSDVALSSQLSAVYFADSYSWAFGLPRTPNAIGSLYANGSAIDGSTITYALSIPAAGNYTLLVHRYMYQPSEYLNVLVNGAAVGSVYFSSTGPTFGTELNLTLAPGSDLLTLVAEGTVSYFDPVDYLVVALAGG